MHNVLNNIIQNEQVSPMIPSTLSNTSSEGLSNKLYATI